MISLGVDIGTTTTRAAAVEIRIGPFGQREFRQIAKPLCVLTPYRGGLLEGDEILFTLKAWAARNHLPPPDVGTLLLTGEAQKTANCLGVAGRITSEWDSLLSAQLNPEMETVTAAYGADAVELSARSPGRAVLHLDIGGGTSNLAWIENGRIIDTACLDLGSRKWTLDPRTNRIINRTAQAALLEKTHPDILGSRSHFDATSALRFAQVIARLILREAATASHPFIISPWKGAHSQSSLLSLSGGVVDCIHQKPENPFAFGDLGVFLGKALEEVAAEGKIPLSLSPEEGRATALGVSAYGFSVSGASVHSTQKSALRNVPLYSEAGFQQLQRLPPYLAIELDPFLFRIERIGDVARLWARELNQRNLQPSSHVIFLLRENLGKTFGYHLQREIGADFRGLTVLDEIQAQSPLTQNDLPIRSLDLRVDRHQGRYTVIIKELKLF